MIRYYIYFILILTLVSCSNQTSDERLNVAYIKSYNQLTSEHSRKVLEILKPFGVNDNETDIKGIYNLEVLLNTNLYSQEESNKYIFLGVLYKNDSIPHQVYCIHKEMGTVSSTTIIGETELLINNIEFLFGSLEPIKGCKSIPIDSRVIEYSKKEKQMFRAIAMATKLFGTWERKEKDKKPHHSKFDNGIWQFIREDRIIITSNSGDTIVNDNFKMHGYELEFEKSRCPYEILTLTSKAIVFYESDSKSVVKFYKKE
jgi:hypothetical protein